MIGIIHRVSFPWLSGIVCFGLWAALSTFLRAVLPADYLFNHLLTSWVNGICIFLAGTVLGFIYRRNHDLNQEERWKEAAYLPKLPVITSYGQIASIHLKMHESNKRPYALLKAVYDSLNVTWCPQRALATLDTKYGIETDRIATRYSNWIVVARVISACGLFGTLLGVSQSLPSIQNMNVARVALHVAFDTSLVSIVVGNAVLYYCRLLQRYDANVLIDVYEDIFDSVVQPIKVKNDLPRNATSPGNRNATAQRTNGTQPKKAPNEKK